MYILSDMLYLTIYHIWMPDVQEWYKVGHVSCPVGPSSAKQHFGVGGISVSPCQSF
jgi:hypothetical protein